MKRAIQSLLLFFLIIFVQSAHSPSAYGQDKADLWAALRDGNAFAIMRHALAPGTGDPANLTLGDCSTQRNLSEEGREQSRRIGQQFRDNGMNKAYIYSSEWCRCMETAELLNIGKVNALQPLNSFFRFRERREPQTKALKTWLTENKAKTPLVLVTHMVNIYALTNTFTTSGEIVVVRPEADGNLTVLGTL